MKVWTIIPVIMFITLIYLGLGSSAFLSYFSYGEVLAHWRYTINDWVVGNGLVCLGVGLCYLGKNIYKKIKDKNGIS